MPTVPDLVRWTLTLHAVLLAAVRAVYAWRARAAGSRRPHPEGASAVPVVLGVVWGYGAVVASWWAPDAWLPTFATFLPGLYATGLLVLGAQAVLLVRAHAALGPAWSGWLALARDHRLVTHGAYATARHPMYGSALLWPLGTTLVAPVPLFAPLWLLALGVVLRVRREERMLEQAFGDEWRQYAARTRRFF
jgi:protein-S-isoprenylcysteine O-methyltransferase Ste14